MSGSTNKSSDDRIAERQRTGTLTPPSKPLPLELLRTPPPRAEQSVLDAVIEEREDER
jgi:hypothetical protein